MKTTAPCIFVLVMTTALLSWSAAQAPRPIPTLTVPTLVPLDEDQELPGALANESAVADIIANGVFKAGVLYNEPPYSEFTLQGDLRGFDIDLIRLIAETWGSEVEFVQVTRENALDKLNRGQVHAVAAAFVRYRDLDERVAFSHSYLRGRQAMMARADSPYESVRDLREHLVGYVVGTRTEKALSLWSARLDSSLNLKYYLTLDRAFAALAGGETEGLAAEEQKLLAVSQEYADRVRILDDALVEEPRAFAVRRADGAMRQLLSHSIQLLAKDARLQALHREYFPEDEFPQDLIALWDGIGDELSPAQYAGERSDPSRYTLPHVLRAGVLRVGAVADDRAISSSSRERLAALNRALANELGRRWGVSVEIGEVAAAAVQSLLASGELDIAIGLRPDWRLAAEMDFSAPYLLHGDRLMTPANSRISGFNDLRGRILGVIIGDAGAQERAQAWADSINASVRFFRTSADGAALNLLEFNNAHAIFADSLQLVPHLLASPSALRLTDRWYSRSYYALGLPLADVEFRLLVDYTLQELARDGTLWELSADFILADEPPDFEIVPGASVFAGISLTGA
ncbi:MAG: transporter substrate-binding domain-containing protein [Chloroflexi bacterium]|nr:transporter substrate-binding domain-containing protein [Chloroflexota bacterium]